MKKTTSYYLEHLQIRETRRWHTLLSVLMFVFVQSLFAQTITIGSGTSTGSTLPISPNWGYSYTQQIYTASQVRKSEGGDLEKIRFYASSVTGNAAQWNNWTVYVGHTGKTSFSSATDWEAPGSLTQVFSGTVVPVTGDWFEIEFDTPFEYDGTSNLIIAVHEQAAGFNSGLSFRTFASASNTGIIFRSDTVNPDLSSLPNASTRTGDLAQIQLHFYESCPTPTGLGILEITPYTAKAVWGGDEGAFDIQWGVYGFELETGTVMSDYGTSFTIDNLEPSTRYQYYVRKSCDGDVSSWAGPYDFTTLCAPLTPPTAVETFSTYVENVPATLACWLEAKGDIGTALTGATSAWAGQNYNLNYNADGGANGKAAYVNLHGDKKDWLISSQIDLGDGSIPYQLEYSVSVTPWTGTAEVTTLGEKYVKVVVSTDGGETWAEANVIKTYDSNNIPTNRGRDEAIVLTGYTGVVRIGFMAFSTATSNDSRFYIDNFSVVPVPTCAKPASLTASDITSNSAILSWVSEGSLFDIEWGVTGFTPTGNPTISGVTNDYLLDQLSSVTTYQYYVRQDCGNVDGTSLWVGPFAFTTPQVLGTLDYAEDFEGAINWTIRNSNTLPNKWHIGNAVNNGGANSLYVSNDNGVSNTYTTSTDVTLVVHAYRDIAVATGVGYVNFSFDWKGMGEDTDTAYDYFRVWLVPNTFVPTVGTQIAAGTGRTQLGTNFYRQSDWQTFTKNNLDISSFAGNTMRLVFEWRNDTGGGTGEAAAIDNIAIVVPACAMPTALNAVGITYNSATLNWASTGSSFDIEWGERGFTPTGTPTVTEVANDYVLSNLTQSTSYEFYVRQNCDVNGTSTWAGPYSFRTECLPPNITDVTGGTVCGQGTVELSATGDGQSFAWYASETGTTKLAQGATYTTPVITETTSYWVSAVNGSSGSGGRLAPNAGSTGTTPSSYGLIFTANDSFVLNTTDVYLTGSAGNLVVNLTTATGTVLQTRTVAIPALGTTSSPVAHSITLDFAIEPGNYKLMAASGPNMIREDGSVPSSSYPMAVGDVATITAADLSGTPYTNYYYYFYNWQFTAGCSSPRSEVVATVTTATDIELSTDSVHVCDGVSDTLVTIVSGEENYDNYTWSPSTNVSGSAASGWSFSSVENTVYTLTATNSVSECTLVKVINVTTGKAPVLSLPSEMAACTGNIVEINSGINNGIQEFINEDFSNVTAFPAGWHTVVGSGDAVAVVNANTAGGTANQIRITGNSQSANVTNRAYYGPVDTTGLEELTLQWRNFVNHYMSGSYAYSVKIQTSTDAINWHDTNWVFSPVTASQPASVVSTTISTQDVGSSTFYVSFTMEGRTFGIHNWNIDNVLLTGEVNYDVFWAPATNLYVDAAATVPYVEASVAAKVYFKQDNAGVYNYSLISAAGNCEATASVEVTVGQSPDAPTGNSPQVMEVGQLISDLTVNGSGLTWYADAALTTVIPATTELVHGTVYYVTQSNGTCESAALAITVEIPMGVGEHFNNSFTYHPNPVRDVLQMSYDKEITNVEVINLLGQRVMAVKVNMHTAQIDMAHLPEGTYLVKVSADNKVKTIKVIKK